MHALWYWPLQYTAVSVYFFLHIGDAWWFQRMHGGFKPNYWSFPFQHHQYLLFSYLMAHLAGFTTCVGSILVLYKCSLAIWALSFNTCSSWKTSNNEGWLMVYIIADFIPLTLRPARSPPNGCKCLCHLYHQPHQASNASYPQLSPIGFPCHLVQTDMKHGNTTCTSCNQSNCSCGNINSTAMDTKSGCCPPILHHLQFANHQLLPINH